MHPMHANFIPMIESRNGHWPHSLFVLSLLSSMMKFVPFLKCNDYRAMHPHIPEITVWVVALKSSTYLNGRYNLHVYLHKNSKTTLHVQL